MSRVVGCCCCCLLLLFLACSGSEMEGNKKIKGVNIIWNIMKVY